jgi:peptidoglycan/LPS O-acetylase OafA/YrhL
MRLGRQPALDGLRGIAILLVVLHHAAQWPSGGFLGVDLFFVLSGFLITTLLLEESAVTGRISLRRFYARRALRLLPALAVMLAGFIVVSVAVGDNPFIVLKRAALGVSYTANIAAAWWPDSQRPPLRHLWSLAMEEQFYLVWPVALLGITRFARTQLRLVLCLAIAGLWLETVVLVATDHVGNRIYMGPDTRAIPLLVGCLLASVVAVAPLRIPRLTAALAILAALYLALFLHSDRPDALILGIPLFAVATAVLIAAGITIPRLESALSWWPLVQLGAISYALYLWHPLTLLAVGSPAGHPAGIARPVLGVLAAIGIAAASRILVERPFLRLKRRLRHDEPTPQPALAIVDNGRALEPAPG